MTGRRPRRCSNASAIVLRSRSGIRRSCAITASSVYAEGWQVGARVPAVDRGRHLRRIERAGVETSYELLGAIEQPVTVMRAGVPWSLEKFDLAASPCTPDLAARLAGARRVSGRAEPLPSDGDAGAGGGGAPLVGGAVLGVEFAELFADGDSGKHRRDRPSASARSRNTLAQRADGQQSSANGLKNGPRGTRARGSLPCPFPCSRRRCPTSRTSARKTAGYRRCIGESGRHVGLVEGG